MTNSRHVYSKGDGGALAGLGLSLLLPFLEAAEDRRVAQTTAFQKPALKGPERPGPDTQAGRWGQYEGQHHSSNMPSLLLPWGLYSFYICWYRFLEQAPIS